MAFTLAGISGIQTPVFASRSKSWDFYKCGHKNLTNYRDQHRAANRNTSCDYLGISAIICLAADVWTLKQITLVFSIPSFQASVSKTRAMLDIRHAQFGDQNHPARRSARYFRLSEQAQKYLNISIVIEILIFLVYECAYYLVSNLCLIVQSSTENYVDQCILKWWRGGGGIGLVASITATTVKPRPEGHMDMILWSVFEEHRLDSTTTDIKTALFIL